MESGPPKPRDKFIIQFPSLSDGDEIFRELKILRKALNAEYLQKNAPPGSVVLALLDAHGISHDVGDTQTIKSGLYTIQYQTEEDDEMEGTKTEAEDIARAFYSIRCFCNQKKEVHSSLTDFLIDGKHDILATATGTVHYGAKSWTYLISLTLDSVLVTIDCQTVQDSFFDFKKAIEFNSTCGQGSGTIHPVAYRLASSLPISSLLSLCTSNTDPFDWKSISQFKKIAGGDYGKRKLVFTGSSLSGMVAHVAALMVREISLRQEYSVEVRAITFNTPFCVSSSIAHEMMASELHNYHLTFIHESDLKVKLYQLAFDVQTAKYRGQDNIFDSEKLISELKTLLRATDNRKKEAWDIFTKMYQGALDMIHSHGEAMRLFQFVPLGVFGRESTVRLQQVIKMTDDEYEVKQWIECITMSFSKVKSHQMSLRLLTDNAKFDLLASSPHIKSISNILKPIVHECHVRITPAKENRAAQYAFTFTGANLDTIIQRDSADTSFIGIGLKGYHSPCKSPILFHDIKSLDYTNGCSARIIRCSANDCKIQLNGIELRSERVKVSVFNDFGESPSFKTSPFLVDSDEKLELKMFTTLNEDILITTFLRSMMIIFFSPELYLLQNIPASPTTFTHVTTPKSCPSRAIVPSIRRPFRVAAPIPVPGSPGPSQNLVIGKRSQSKSPRARDYRRNSTIQIGSRNEVPNKEISQSSSLPATACLNPSRTMPIRVHSSPSISIMSSESLPVPRFEKIEVKNLQKLKCVPESLALLFEVEKLILNQKTSVLQQIAEDYCDKQDDLPYAVTKARKVIDRMVLEFMAPLKIKYDNIVYSVLRKIAGGVGVLAGGVITVTGGTLAAPGILLLAGSMLPRSDEDNEDFHITDIPGIVLALPGLGVGAVGVWLVQRSLAATKDIPSIQYAQILKLLLKVLGYDPNQVLDEVPALEYRVTLEANLHIKTGVTDKMIESHTTSLWTISDEDLHTILTAVDHSKGKREKYYANARTSSKRALRSWMQICGRIHRIRHLNETHLVIGFVGVHNAGKSTWINTLFDLGVMADSIERTESVDLLPLSVSKSEELNQMWKQKNPSPLRLSVVDYPGSSDQRDMIAQMADRLSNVTTLFVCVFRFGYIAKPEKQVIDMVKRANRDFVVFINQCDIARDLDTREHLYRSNYAGVLEIDETRLHFVSSFDERRVEYVRHLLWSHLQILSHTPEDKIELGIHLVKPTTKDTVLENFNNGMDLYATVVHPFEKGTQFNNLLDQNTALGAVMVPKSRVVNEIHTEVFEWLLEIGQSEKEIEALYQCIYTHSLTMKSESIEPSNMKILQGLYESLCIFNLDEDIMSLRKENSQMALVCNIITKIKTTIAITQADMEISYEIALGALIECLKTKQTTYEALRANTSKVSVTQSDTSITTIFRRNDLLNNLGISTRCRPVPKISNTPFTEYKGYSGNTMPLLKRIDLFTKYAKKQKKAAKQMKKESNLKSVPSWVDCDDLSSITKKILSFSANDLQMSEVEGWGPFLQYVAMLLNSECDSGISSTFIKYDGGLYFSPLATDSDTLRAIGRLVGISLQHKEQFNVDFSHAVFKVILGMTISFVDLDNFSPQFGKQIRTYCNMSTAELDELHITFIDRVKADEASDSITASNLIYEEIDLVENGKELRVSSVNLTEYLRVLVLHRLCNHLPLQSFVLGVQDVVPRTKLCLFSPQMLQVMVNGTPNFEVNHLRINYIEAVSQNPPEEVVQWFWECLSEMDKQDRALLIVFITGTSVHPFGIQYLKPNFTIKSFRGSVPTNNTTNNMLLLPSFKAKQQLVENLLLVIRDNPK